MSTGLLIIVIMRIHGPLCEEFMSAPKIGNVSTFL